MDFLKLAQERVSYRGQYKNETVPHDDLVKIMQAGLAAPSGCNQQTTSLIAVDAPELLDRIKAMFKKPVAATAPAMICVLAKNTPSYRGISYHVQDYSAAIENMLLEIKSLGYDSCWYEGYVTNEDRVGEQIAELFEIPDEYKVVCVLPVGIAEDEPRYAPKMDFDERAWFNGFKK
ncbi:MAG: nitroreductase family protein [Oscillospiraceae bacterium]|nr:nitroreductase family protein [Oscillospiraceae bacterium]